MNPPDTLVGTLWKRHNRIYVVLIEEDTWCRLVALCDPSMRDHIFKEVLCRWYERITGEKNESR